MIKFFRKIRQDLLLENKTGKYFKYAIGEIILVVIGILIALSINNWNENRLKSIETSNYLMQIKNELLIDLQNFNTDLKQIQQSTEYLNKISEGKYNEVELTLLLHYLTANLDARNFGTSFNKLTESGAIELIDAELRQKLQTYYITTISGYNNVVTYHARFNLENIEGPLLLILRHEKDFTVSSKEVLEKLETENIISMVNWQISFMEAHQSNFEKVVDDVQELINLINEETITKAQHRV
jgi:hypothetical protein